MSKYVLCKFLGGSHLYGMNTPASDIDERGVFAHTDPAYILGTKRDDEERKQNPDIKEDIIYKELNHFAGLLKQSNSEAIEAMVAPVESFEIFTPEWKKIRDLGRKVIDSEKLFKCLRGYMQGEYRLAIGERKGTIGGKRYAQVLEYGFSPKNFCQLFRLAHLGQKFFLEDRFVINVKTDGDKDVYDYIMSVKTTPWLHNKESLTVEYNKYETALTLAYENRVASYTLDEDALNKTLLDIYLPFLNKI